VYDAIAEEMENKITEWALMSVQDIIALYEFRRFASWSEKQIREPPGARFDKAPEMQCLCMWQSEISSIVEFFGNFRTHSDPTSAEYKRRDAFRKSLRYLFVEICWLTWKYRINIDPNLKGPYEKSFLQKWRTLTASDQDYMDIMTGFDGLNDISVCKKISEAVATGSMANWAFKFVE
jgi:hypothetical protein